MTAASEKEEWAFAEAVRKQAAKIAALIAEGRPEEAEKTAVNLGRAAERRKGRLSRRTQTEDTRPAETGT